MYADLDKTESEDEASGSDDEGDHGLPDEEDEGIPGALEDDMRYVHIQAKLLSQDVKHYGGVLSVIAEQRCLP